MPVTVLANAKINLFLDLGANLPNGYHSIFTVMQSVNLSDTLRLERKTAGVSASCTDAAVPVDEKNLACRAASLYLEKAGLSEGVHIHIEKRIPMQAGLAGGSTDAAGALIAMQKLFDNALSDRELYGIAVRCGADVPFCLQGGMGLCQNIGEITSQLPSLRDVCIVLAKPRRGVATAQAYKSYDDAKWVRHPDREQFLYYAAHGNTTEILRRCTNVFEQVVEVPGRVDIKSVMRAYRASCACMSGSGSCIYGIYTQESDAKDAYEALQQCDCDRWLCRPAEQGIVIC